MTLPDNAAVETLYYYLTRLTLGEKVIEEGWMLGNDDRELIDYARQMGYGIDITFLGEADMSSVTPALIERRAS